MITRFCCCLVCVFFSSSFFSLSLFFSLLFSLDVLSNHSVSSGLKGCIVAIGSELVCV